MDCHLNCHGELNALLLALPVLSTLLLRLRAALRQRALRRHEKK